jgi:hypothetical protein
VLVLSASWDLGLEADAVRYTALLKVRKCCARERCAAL